MKQPNVVVCMCDQLRAFEVGCYGNRVVKTPAIDALAQAGTRFDLAVSNNPVCSPARACMLSGQYSRSCLGKLGNEAEEFPARDLNEQLCRWNDETCWMGLDKGPSVAVQIAMFCRGIAK